MRVAITWAELIIHWALNSLLSRTITFDGKLMTDFPINVKRIRACWWWCTHRKRQASTLQCTYFLSPSHTHTPPASLSQRLTFPSHTSAVLHSSAWIRALVWAITSSTGGEGPSIPPSICYSIPGSMLGRERDESNTGWKRTSHHLHEILCDHKENWLIWFLHARVKKKKKKTPSSSISHARSCRLGVKK